MAASPPSLEPGPPVIYSRPRPARLGGATIGELFRLVWEKLAHKQWLILYPLVLGVINTLAFFAVYVAQGGGLSLTAFFRADFDRYAYVKTHFVTGFSWSTGLAVAVVAGVMVCVLTTMIRAPYIRAVLRMGYPLAPRDGHEAGNLFVIYFLSYLVLWVSPTIIPEIGGVQQVAVIALHIVAILIAFAGYLVVYEQMPFLSAFRGSVRIVGHRWLLVLVTYLVAQLALYGAFRVYKSYYASVGEIFILLPLSRLLVQALIVLLFDLVLISVYQQVRRKHIF